LLSSNAGTDKATALAAWVKSGETARRSASDRWLVETVVAFAKMERTVQFLLGVSVCIALSDAPRAHPSNIDAAKYGRSWTLFRSTRKSISRTKNGWSYCRRSSSTSSWSPRRNG
jgi:hypothetical protein